MAETKLAHAYIKGVDSMPRKAGIVAALVRDRYVADALVILDHTPRRAARAVKKAIESAKAMADEGDKMLSIPGALEGKVKPDYNKMIQMATQGALKKMLVPSILAMVIPAALIGALAALVFEYQRRKRRILMVGNSL